MAAGTTVEVVMPQMGVSVSEGTVTRWLKNIGEAVTADEALLEISTDKVDTEVPSPGTGVLQEILVPEGETVAVGTLLARIGAGEAAPRPEATPQPSASPPAPAAEPEAHAEFPPEPELVSNVYAPEDVDEEAALDDDTDEEPAVASPAPAGASTGNGSGTRHAFVSPVVARIAAEHGIDPSSIPGSGREGRVTKRDILAFVESRPDQVPGPARVSEPAAPPPQASAPSTPPGPPAPAPPVAAAPPPSPPPPPAARPQPRPVEAGEQLEPMSAMRRGIAEHMRRSLDIAAHVTSAIEVDMSRVVAIREKLKGEYSSAYGVNPTYLAFVARATVETLREWPLANAELRGESILTRNYVNLGFAVALDGGKGLIVPVLKNAEGLNLLGMARGIADLAERARTKKLLPDDVQGGTFTITNPGGYGTFVGTPIINQPQTAILGTYAVVKRPWVITDDAGNDAIAIRPIMNLTLTYDHRLVDGAYGAQVLRALTDRLQGWGEADY
jgi:pyruvate/2-oxoglutarate dehydrogenase complex dihydrolipoamide acyltransferase (E2) component